MDKVRVVVVGCGYFGSLHAEVYSQLATAQLVGVADINPEAAHKLADRLGVRAYTSYEPFLTDASIDMVDVCTPDCFHSEIALAVMAAHKHLLVEKPLADSMEGAGAIYRAAQSYDKKFMVGHICRFDVRYMRAFEAIRSGELGDIIFVSSRRNSPTLGAYRYAKHCKLLTHSGIHDMDLIRWFLGSEYKSVYALGRKKRMVSEGIDTYDSIQALFTFENGVTYSLENCWALPDRFPAYIDAKIEIVGTKSSLYIDFFDQGLMRYSNDGCTADDISYWPESMGNRMGDIRAELEHFVECILFDRTPRVSAEDGYRVAYAAVRALDALETGTVQQIEYR